MGSVQYPSLMSQHQKTQGYTPSLGSMFRQSPMPHHHTSSSSSALLLFPGGEPSSSTSGLYANLLPKPSMPAPTPPPYPIQASQSHHHPPPSARPPLPPPPSHEPSHHRQDSARIQHSSADPVNHNLKHVNFPRDCLNRFLSIAAVNTSMNRETCGLLLGKDKGSKFVVTTLLIPKQHSTSDTCTMDEEELVMMFTEERSLITLGWVRLQYLLLYVFLWIVGLRLCWWYVVDSYASHAVMFHEFGGSAYPFRLPTNVTRVLRRRLCAEVDPQVSTRPPISDHSGDVDAVVSM